MTSQHAEDQKRGELYYAEEMAKKLKVDWQISSSPNETEYPDLIVCEKVNGKRHKF